MARRKAVEPEEFFEAANRLRSEGKEVSATALLDALGGGSLRTIYRLLELWERDHTTDPNPASTEIPPEVMAGFSNAWRLITQAADRNIQAAQEKAEGEVEATLKKFQVALDASDKLESENEELGRQIEDLKAKLIEWETLAHNAMAESAGHKATADQLEKQIAKQEKDLERIRNEAEAEREKHRQSHQLATSTIDSVREQLKKAQETTKLAEAEAREHQKMLDKAETARDKDRLERDAAIKEAAEFRGQVEALKAQYTQIVEAFERSEKST